MRQKSTRKRGLTKSKQPTRRTRFGILIPVTKHRVTAPHAYVRLMHDQCPELSPYNYLPLSAAPGKPPMWDLTRIAALMKKIRWRSEIKDDYRPAVGWGDCDSKVTRGIVEFLDCGWPRGSLRMILGRVPARPDPIWHAALSVWWEGLRGSQCAVLDPRFHVPQTVAYSRRRMSFDFIEMAGNEPYPFAVVSPALRPPWAPKSPVRSSRSRLTLETLFQKSLGR